MKRILFLVFLFFLNAGFELMFGQAASVKFEVEVPSDSSLQDSSVFLSGSFNCWNPKDSMYIMKKNGDDLYSLIIPVFDGKKYEYKYTRGSWNSVEVSSNGTGIKNRQIFSYHDMVVKDTVLKWKSNKTSGQKDTTLKLTKEQQEHLKKIKEEMAKELMVKMKDVTGNFKKAITNMLSEKPDMKLKKKYHNEIAGNINYALQIAGDAMWKVASMLSPEQKKALLTEMNKPDASGDLFGLMSKALNIHEK